MERLHKIFLKLPIFTVWYYLFCAVFFSSTKFYKEYFEILDNIDTVLVYLMAIHFVFFHKKYSVCVKLYLQCIYAIVILNFMYSYLSESTYYLFFYAITLTYILLSFWKAKPQPKIKD